MTMIDWLHHLLSSLLIGYLNLSYTYGPILNYALFFMCGLPGGIDYFLLFLTKCHLINSLTEKWINSYLNFFCRMPFVMWWMGISYTCYRNNNHHGVPFSVLILNYIFVGGNALYFSYRVLVNYTIKKYIERKKM